MDTFVSIVSLLILAWLITIRLQNWLLLAGKVSVAKKEASLKWVFSNTLFQHFSLVGFNRDTGCMPSFTLIAVLLRQNLFRLLLQKDEKRHYLILDPIALSEAPSTIDDETLTLLSVANNVGPIPIIIQDISLGERLLDGFRDLFGKQPDELFDYSNKQHEALIKSLEQVVKDTQTVRPVNKVNYSLVFGSVFLIFSLLMFTVYDFIWPQFLFGLLIVASISKSPLVLFVSVILSFFLMLIPIVVNIENTYSLFQGFSVFVLSVLTFHSIFALFDKGAEFLNSQSILVHYACAASLLRSMNKERRQELLAEWDSNTTKQAILQYWISNVELIPFKLRPRIVKHSSYFDSLQETIFEPKSIKTHLAILYFLDQHLRNYLRHVHQKDRYLFHKPEVDYFKLID